MGQNRIIYTNSFEKIHPCVIAEKCSLFLARSHWKPIHFFGAISCVHCTVIPISKMFHLCIRLHSHLFSVRLFTWMS